MSEMRYAIEKRRRLLPYDIGKCAIEDLRGEVRELLPAEVTALHIERPLGAPSVDVPDDIKRRIRDNHPDHNHGSGDELRRLKDENEKVRRELEEFKRRQTVFIADEFERYCEECIKVVENCANINRKTERVIKAIQTPTPLKLESNLASSYHTYLEATADFLLKLSDYERLVLVDSDNCAAEIIKLLPFLAHVFRKKQELQSTNIRIRFLPVNLCLRSLLTEVDFIFTRTSFAIAFHTSENKDAFSSRWETSIHFDTTKPGKIYQFLDNLFYRFWAIAGY